MAAPASHRRLPLALGFAALAVASPADAAPDAACGIVGRIAGLGPIARRLAVTGDPLAQSDLDFLLRQLDPVRVTRVLAGADGAAALPAVLDHLATLRALADEPDRAPLLGARLDQGEAQVRAILQDGTCAEERLELVEDYLDGPPRAPGQRATPTPSRGSPAKPGPQPASPDDSAHKRDAPETASDPTDVSVGQAAPIPPRATGLRDRIFLAVVGVQGFLLLGLIVRRGIRALCRARAILDRAHARRPCRRRASMVVDGRTVRCLIVDVSRDGVGIATPEPVARGTSVEVDLPGGPFRGKVMWASDFQLGVRFDTRLEGAAIDTLLDDLRPAAA